MNSAGATQPVPAARPDFVRALEPLTEKIIGCALEVHRELGPGLLESAYEAALVIELAEAGLACRSQVAVPMMCLLLNFNSRLLKHGIKRVVL